MNYLKEVSDKFPQTQLWNDSCSLEELSGSIADGAVGATTNPVIVYQVIKEEWDVLKKSVREKINELTDSTEDEIAWKVIEDLGIQAAKLLEPEFKKSEGKRGRISLQTNAKYYRDTQKMVDQAIQLCSLFENSQVKAPTSEAGVQAFEEMTYHGLSINATVCFSVPQALAVAQAVERGLNRREKEGLSNASIHPVCTIMVGRLDDALKDYVKENDVEISKEALELAGIAVAKKVYQLFNDRNYKTKLLVAAYRNIQHYTAFIGGDLVLTIPRKWQLKINAEVEEVSSNINESVSDVYLKELMKIPMFNQAYEEDGMAAAEFEKFPAFKKTILQFLRGYDSLVDLLREEMIYGQEDKC